MAEHPEQLHANLRGKYQVKPKPVAQPVQHPAYKDELEGLCSFTLYQTSGGSH